MAMVDVNVSNITLPRLDYTDRMIMFWIYLFLTIFGIVGNAVVLAYIVIKKFYVHFVSNHFICHVTFVNFLSCLYLVTIFLYHMYADDPMASNLFQRYPLLCRFQAFVNCVIWTVIYYMIACIAGVHYLTFARIHYEQVFGLAPWIICSLAWVIGFCLALPLLTNSSIIKYDPHYYHCIWGMDGGAYKFIAYMSLLGVFTPLWLTFYAYVRILALLYKYRVVFDTRTIDLFRSRHVVYGILFLSLGQLPLLFLYFVESAGGPISNMPVTKAIVIFLAYSTSLFSWIFYGMSIFFMKEDDIALTHRRPTVTQANTAGPSGVGHMRLLTSTT